MTRFPAPADPQEPTPPAACPNCGHAFAGPAPPFCPQCGQETRVRPPKLGEFLQQLGGAYLSTEGALWRTLKLLFMQPGELTRRYLAGQRKHFVLPLRLYLTISVLVLLLVRVLAHNSIDVQLQTAANTPRQATPGKVQMEIFGGRAGVKDGQYFCQDLPGWMCQRLQRRLATDTSGMKQQMAEVGERVLGQLGTAMFVLLPSFALWLRLAYWNRRLRYTEHLVMALHLHAFWFVMLALSVLDLPWLSALAFLALPVYTVLACRRVYGGSLWSHLWRNGLLSFAHVCMLSLVLVGLTFWSLLT